MSLHRARRASTLTVAALLLLVLALASCKQRTAQQADGSAATEAAAAAAAAAAQAATRPALGLDAMKAALRKLEDEAVVERGKVATTAANIASYQSTVRKYAREAEEVRLFERVPTAPEADKLRAAIVDALAPGGLRPSITVRERRTQRRPLPATVPEGPRFEPVQDDFRGVLDVRIELPGAAAEKLADVLRRLGAMMRLVFATRAHSTPSALQVDAEAYYFYTDNRFPKVALRERELDAALRERGIEPAALAGDPEAQKALDALASDYREMREKRADYGRALDMQGDLTRSDAQMRFARDRASEAGDRTAKELLGAPATAQ